MTIGARRFSTRPVKGMLGDRTSTNPTLTAVNRVERAIVRAFKRGERVEVRVSARFRDVVGNEETKKRTIVLR